MMATETRTAALSRYFFVVVVLWVVLGSGALVYARMKSVPGWVAAPVSAAFLLEVPFYLLPGFAEARERARAALGGARLAAAMVASALLPYLIYAVPTGAFRPGAFGLLALIAAGVAYWYILLPRRVLPDALFLAALAGIVLSKVFARIYLDPVPKLHLDFLGHIMLIRLAALEILEVRGGVAVEFRFWPRRKEWIAGLRWSLPALFCAGIAYWMLGLITLRPRPLAPALAIGTFFGILFVVALSEEFFFRGLLQNWLEKWLSGWVLALILASALFGAAHLGFAHAFPNWRFSIVAGIAGVFYGLAWRETGAVQASMVTHALLVTVWRVFLR